MSEIQNDQKILTIIVKLFVDIFNLTNIWSLPDNHNAIINFAGRNMQTIQEPDWKKFQRKITFSVDELSSLALQLVLHSLQIGRAVNKIRISQGRPTVDWYQRAVEEDNREKEEKQ